MADSSTSLGTVGSEIPALKEALFAQQQLLQKLYNELDVEREASASATSEALSMIFRLQGEKASVKMEANQYKRLAEEKMCHAEEALAIFEDLIYQKEMEITSLEYQVQAYRCKLLSLGCTDIGACETMFPENLLLRNENLIGDTVCKTNLRRNSMPLLPLKFSNQRKGSFEKERSVSPELSSKIKEEIHNSKISDMERPENYTAGDITSYREQIRKLDERVREIADGKGVKSKNLRSGSRSFSVNLDPPKGPIATKSSQLKNPENLLENEATVNPCCYSSVHDVFEVPQTRESEKGRGEEIEPERELVLEGNGRDGKPDSVPLEAFKSHANKETDWVRKMFPSKQQKDNLSGPSERVAPDCHLALVRSTTDVAQSHSKFQQFNIGRTSEIIEVERYGEGPETASRGGEEELKLLKEIQEQLKSIQSEIKSLKTVKSPPSYELPLLSLTEFNIGRTSEIIEVERYGEGPETASRGGEEELKLLKEIQEQLKSIQSEIKSLKTVKSPPSYELPLLSLTEVLKNYLLVMDRQCYTFGSDSTITVPAAPTTISINSPPLLPRFSFCQRH